MIDRDQLREALGAWFADEEWFPREAGAVLAEAARLVADPDTLTITKVDGEWPTWVVERVGKEFWAWHLAGKDDFIHAARLGLDALLEGQPK